MPSSLMLYNALCPMVPYDPLLSPWRGITQVVLLLSSARRHRRGFFEDSVLALKVNGNGAELRHSRFQLFKVQRHRGGRRLGKCAAGEEEEEEQEEEMEEEEKDEEEEEVRKVENLSVEKCIVKPMKISLNIASRDRFCQRGACSCFVSVDVRVCPCMRPCMCPHHSHSTRSSMMPVRVV